MKKIFLILWSLFYFTVAGTATRNQPLEFDQWIRRPRLFILWNWSHA
uniref:Csu649(Scp) n=1 Tax=Arundo donax TaxID=35708 RepID=A0A0A8Z7W7_ARUDO